MLCLPLAATTIAKGYNLRKCEMFTALSRMPCYISFFSFYFSTTNPTSLYVYLSTHREVIFRFVKKYQIASRLTEKKTHSLEIQNSNRVFTVRI